MFITEVDEVVSRLRFLVERSATTIPNPGAISGPRARRAASSGDLLLWTVSSDMVAELPRQPRQPSVSATRAASPLAQRYFRISLHLSHPMGVPKTSVTAEWPRYVRRDRENGSRSCRYG